MTQWREESAERDAVSALGWGMRRYAWFVALCMLVLGVVVPVVLKSGSPTRYQAQAEVGPTAELNLPNLDPLPRLGETVFTNGAVAAAVRQSYHPALAATQSVIPSRVELVAPQDNLIFTVLGRGATATEAKDVANVAAGTFTDELNKYGTAVGTFAVQRSASTPAAPLPSINGLLAVVAGLLGGLVLGIGSIGAVLAWRRPILDSVTAERVAGAPVYGTVQLDPSSDEARGMPQLCHRLLEGRAQVIFLAGHKWNRYDRGRLASELRNVLAGPRAVTVLSGGHQSFWGATPEVREEGHDADLLIVDGPTQTELAVRHDGSLTLLVLPVGVSESVLRREAEYFLDPGATGIVLVRGPHWSGSPISSWRARAGRSSRATDTAARR
jgi:hypothetical protein